MQATKGTPESQLLDIYKRIHQATNHQSASTKKTAMKWFNRLYHDVRKWNESFINVLKTYPGFKENATEEEFADFGKIIKEYDVSLNERSGHVKNELCRNLKMLSARFYHDFNWLHEQDIHLYHEIARLIDESYRTENHIIEIARGVTHFIQWDIRFASPNEVIQKIGKYEERSRLEVQRLHELAESYGEKLLTVTEYDEALNMGENANSNIMYFTEAITVADQRTFIGTVTGSILNINSRLESVTQTIGSTSNLQADEKQELIQLIEELKEQLKPVSEANPEAAETIINESERIAEELKRSKPQKKFLNMSIDGLKEAAETVKDIAPALIAVASQIATAVVNLKLG